MVPGHELAGTVTEVGAKVTKVKVGDNVGLGVVKDACLDCPMCKKGDEQYCQKGAVHTYNSMKTKGGHIGGNPDTQNFGGYAGSEVCHEHFIVKIPDGYPLKMAGPILCAGITVYDPLVYFGSSTKKLTVGIIGIGGLGTMGIKIAHIMGHRVVAISRGTDKEAMAKEKGADAYVDSKNPESSKAEEGKIDLILNTIPVAHQLADYLPLLANDGTIVQLGLNPTPHSISQLSLLFGRKVVTSSYIGGVKASEDLLELCTKHQIYPDTEMVEAKQIDWVWEQLADNKDGIRYVIDTKKSLASDFVPKAE